MFPADLNNHGQLLFADLALKFAKIEMKSASNDFFLNFEVNPLNQALDVHGAAGP